MSTNDNLSFIPDEIKSQPWVLQLIGLIQEQTQRIQEQTQRLQEQSEKIEALKQTVQEQQDELNKLKNLPKRPKFRSGGGKPKERSGKPGNNNQAKKSKPVDASIPTKVKEEIKLAVHDVPTGSRFKGYQDYFVQELELIPKDIVYRQEVWETPDGTILRGSLPPEVKGSHYGYQLRAAMYNLYALGMTEPALFDFLTAFGIEISEGQVHNILMSESEKFEQISEEILAVGLKEAPYIRVDDTGAKHQHQNSYCTHIGGEHFAYYKTTSSKSRENFLRILLQGKEGYLINEAFIWHLFELGVEDDLLNRFEEYTGKKFGTRKGLIRLLNNLGIGNKKLRMQCIEAGLIGFINKTVMRDGQVLLSDRAGQFAVFNHAACWVHMERPLRKLKTCNPEAEKELEEVRKAIWDLYDKVKDAALTQRGKEEVHELYDKFVRMRSMSPGVNEVIESFRKYREELLKALDYPGLPLHNNDSERDIRSVAKRRNISGTTKSTEGKAFRDGLLTIKQTCARLGISLMGYLRSWFKREPMSLAEIVRDRYQACTLH